LALDHNPKPTQKKICEAISKGIGTGEVECLEAKGTEKNLKELTINLRMKPTMIFAKIEEEDAAIEADEGVEVARFKFPWRSREGIQKSIELLRQEFNKVHGLSQEKIFIMGPPGSGKTYFSQKYSLHNRDSPKNTTCRTLQSKASSTR
jgi:predicted NACHT family NTPase